ncbi:MAG: hypothetical protein ACJAYR_001092 [Sneathiella sp.]
MLPIKNFVLFDPGGGAIWTTLELRAVLKNNPAVFVY